MANFGLVSASYLLSPLLTHSFAHSFIRHLATPSSCHVSDTWTRTEQAGVGIQRLKSHGCPRSPTPRPCLRHLLGEAPELSEHGGGRSQPGLEGVMLAPQSNSRVPRSHGGRLKKWNNSVSTRMFPIIFQLYGLRLLLLPPAMEKRLGIAWGPSSKGMR